ncbi:MAG: hypothetical protein KA715_05790 [Xanthomonadaceae bacterium]|nr:hypothetical protein [Xanthomonadaceae bacterium]
MAQSTLNKEKYLAIAKTRGHSFALTELHLDMEKMEQKCMEGPEGFQKAIWDDLVNYREFSLELWQLDPSKN